MGEHGRKGARGERRNKGILAARREQRRVDAEARQKARRGRSDTHQIWLLKNERPGKSRKERGRLRGTK